MPRIANIFTEEYADESDRAGFRWRGARIGLLVGAAKIGATVYELADGDWSFPYHFHHGVEEWCWVLRGTPLLRSPDGERELREGDVVCFALGAPGAHALRGPGRVMLFSCGAPPYISVYPDSDKVGVRPGPGGDRLMFRRGDAVDYWEGE